MSYVEEHSLSRARALLCTQPMPNDMPPFSGAPVNTGWKQHIMPRSDAPHMRITALTPVSYLVVDAIEMQLQALGLTSQGSHMLNKDSVGDGEYMMTADAPTYDGKHVQGLSITVNQTTFDQKIAPQLERWREATRGASIR